tara:strand:- start:1585 stop:1833 length:249 start_codon:yes stop_codon:yes gene_type:complete
MYLLGLGLLVLSTWYLLKLYDSFNDDQIAKKEISHTWESVKTGAKGKNPFAPGRIRDAITSYKKELGKKASEKEVLQAEEAE